MKTVTSKPKKYSVGPNASSLFRLFNDNYSDSDEESDEERDDECLEFDSDDATSLIHEELAVNGREKVAEDFDARPITFNLADVPIVSFRFDKFKCRALVDTGSSITVVRPQIAIQTRRAWLPWSGDSLRVADGREVEPLGVMMAELEFKKKCILMSVAVVNGINTDLILGNNFLAPMDIAIMSGARHISFRSDVIDNPKPLLLDAVPDNPNKYCTWIASNANVGKNRNHWKNFLMQYMKKNMR